MDWPLILAAGGVGLLVGSFIGAAALRLPRGESIVTGRSHCDVCGHRLGIGELVPILSWLASRGRCRKCGAPIDRQHLVAELGGVAVGASAFAVGESPGHGMVIALFGWQALFLAILDARHYWLPYRAIALLGLSAIIVPALLIPDETGVLRPLLEQVAGGALGFALLAAPALFYRAVLKRDGLGKADPWLLGALGLWLGVMGAVLTLLLATLAGLALALVLRLSGREVGGQYAVPLGALMAVSAYVLMIADSVLLGG